MRVMFDGIVPGSVPAGAQLYAGYVNGQWPSFAGLAARYPKAVPVSISVTASANVGQVLDVENGDATPQQAVNWVLVRRHAGADPTVYCNTSTWPQVRSAFQTHDVPEPHYWVAEYDGVATIPAGAIAKQYADKGGYDESVVADYWPGVDPAPSPQGADDMTPAQAAQLAQILQLVTDLFNAVFTGGASMGATQPGAPNNSLAASVVAIGAEVAKLTPPTAPAVDATALAAVLAPLLPTAEQIAAAVLAAQGAADTAAAKN